MVTAVTSRGPDDTASSAGTSNPDEKFLRDLVKKFVRVESAESINRQKAVDDLKFKAGDQWPDQIRASRTLDKRPCLTINKMKTFVHQITNDQRQNRPAINVSPVGDRSDPETAKMLRGLIRQIERKSAADVAYDTAFESAVSMGWGYWRVLTDYEDEDTFDQVIKVERIRNPFRVYIDPDTQEPDAADMQWCFITDMITRDEYESLYPDKPIAAWEEGGIGDEYKLWATSTHVRIAEYFCFETEERELVALRNGATVFKDKMDSSLEGQIVKTRTVQAKKIKWYKVTAWDVLDERDWAGKYIPIVRVMGDEVDIEGKVTLAGIIRDAKDPQRMYNFWSTSETELIALAPKAPWIMEEGQIEGHEKRWQEANNKSLPYLLYKGVSLGGKPAPPPQRQQFAGPPAGVVQAKVAAAQDMQAVTGIRFDATLQERMYDESGKALRELKRVSELGSFHYIDNLARALRHTGEIFIDLIPKVYDTPRILTILREDDTEEQVKIDPNMNTAFARQQNQDGRVQRLFNPKLGDYDVAVTIGPNYATKRAESVDSMLAFLKALPNTAPIVADLVAKNMDWNGAQEIYERLQASLPPQFQSKNVQNLPPEARGIVMSLQQQLQETQQKLQQAAAMLGDKEKDRAIDRESLQNERAKIMADNEAKLAKVSADFEAKMAAVLVKMNEDKGDGGKAQADLIAKLEQITANFNAKLIELQAKSDIELMKMASQMEIKHLELKHQKSEGAADRNLRRKEDMDKLKQERQAEIDRMSERHDKSMEKLAEQFKMLKDEFKDLKSSEIIFQRDPKTNRIIGAKRATKH